MTRSADGKTMSLEIFLLESWQASGRQSDRRERPKREAMAQSAQEALTGVHGHRRGRAILTLIALALWASTAAWPAEDPIETIDFEDLGAQCVASEVLGNWGSGPILVHGVSPRDWPAENAAVVVDTTNHPPEADLDLRTPSRGGRAAPTNDRPLYNALIVSKLRPKNGYVAKLDDESIAGGKLRFDFSQLESGAERTRGVTFHGLTLIDRDEGTVRLRLFRGATVEPFVRLETGADSAQDSLYGLAIVDREESGVRGRLVRDPFVEIEIQPIGIDNSVQKVDVSALRAAGARSREILGERSPFPNGIPGVVRLEIEMGGSAAVDEIRFQGRPVIAPADDEQREKDLWEELSKTLDIGRERRMFEKKWNKIEKDASRAGERDYEAELELVEETRNNLIAKLECPRLKCGCPEMRPLRAWVRQRFEVARASIEEAREKQRGDRPAAAARGGRPAGWASPAMGRFAADRSGGAMAAGFALAQKGESGGSILDFIEIELWGPLTRLFGGNRAEKVTAKLSVRGCVSYRYSADSEHAEKAATRSRFCDQEAEIYLGRYEIECSPEEGSWRSLGTLDLVGDEGLVRDGRVVLSCERSADLGGEGAGTAALPASATSR